MGVFSWDFRRWIFRAFLAGGHSYEDIIRILGVRMLRLFRRDVSTLLRVMGVNVDIDMDIVVVIII